MISIRKPQAPPSQLGSPGFAATSATRHPAPDDVEDLEMPVRGEHRNIVGYLHGGVISSLLDIAGAVAGSYGNAKDSVSITVNLNVNFMAPHKADTVVAEGELIRTTSSLFFAQAKLLDPERNLLCASATGTYKKKPREK